MARIRTIKPEFFTDEVVGESSPTTRLLFIATWVFADDYGNLERSSKQLKAQAFPYDSVDIEPSLLDLISRGCLVEYEVGGKKYLHINNFEKHQKVEKKGRPRCPLPDSSPTPPLLLPYSSPTPPLLLPDQSEIEVGSRKLEVGSRKLEGKERERTTPSRKKPSAPASVTEDWLSKLKSNAAYEGINIDRELGKCQAYFDLRGIVPSRQRFLRWLNRAERPVNGAERPGPTPKTADDVLREQAEIDAALAARYGAPAP